MAYTAYQQQIFLIRYILTEAPAAVENTAFIAHHINSEISPDGENWTADQSMLIYVPAGQLEAVLVMNDGAAKANAYKKLLADSKNATPIFELGKSIAGVQARANANAQAAQAAAGADEYITTVAGSYPLTFSY
jgi:hypothetical protein